MALPQINNTPYYDITIPSTGEKTRFRPYLVKEEKILLIAYETQDVTQIANAMLHIIDSCVETMNTLKITTFDMEYIFLQIRSKAVGENVDLKIFCKGSECMEQVDVKVNISEIVIVMPENKNDIIELSEDMSIELKYPAYKAIASNKLIMENESEIEILYETIYECLNILHSKDERIIFADETHEEISNFIGNLNTKQLRKIQDFVESIPVISKDVTFTCEKCNTESTERLQGTSDFF